MEKVRLGDVCTINGGYAFKSDQFSTEGVPVIRIGNITKEGLIIDEDVCYGESFWNENDSYRIAKNDILIAMSGATVGKSCINSTERKLLLNQRVAAINCDNNINLKYIFYSIDSEKFSKYIMTNSIGCAQPNISLKQIANFEVPAVCVEEQNRIADELDKVTDLISKRKKQLEKLDELVKARFVELFGDPATNEKGWGIRNLENVTAVVTYGLTVRPEYISEGIDLVSARELHKGYVDYNAAPKISENDFAKLSEKGKPQKNDILFSKTGSIGHCALVTEEKPFAITQNAARIGLKTEAVNPLWLLYYLRMDYIQDWCKDHAKGNAVKDFQLQDMKVIPLFDCPLELQNQFVAFVEQTDKSKLEIQKSLEKLELLKKSLMQKYFG